jgi:hypothetical protein
MHNTQKRVRTHIHSFSLTLSHSLKHTHTHTHLVATRIAIQRQCAPSSICPCAKTHGSTCFRWPPRRPGLLLLSFACFHLCLHTRMRDVDLGVRSFIRCRPWRAKLYSMSTLACEALFDVDLVVRSFIRCRPWRAKLYSMSTLACEALLDVDLGVRSFIRCRPWRAKLYANLKDENLMSCTPSRPQLVENAWHAKPPFLL